MMVGQRSLRRERWTTDLRQVGNLGGRRLGEGGGGGGGGLGEDGNHCAGDVDGRKKERGGGLYRSSVDGERDVDRANPEPVASIGHE